MHRGNLSAAAPPASVDLGVRSRAATVGREMVMPPCGWGEDVSHVTIHRSSHMTIGRVEVITSVERRRRWSSAEKRELVAATLHPGASVSAIVKPQGVAVPQSPGNAAKATTPARHRTV